MEVRCSSCLNQVDGCLKGENQAICADTVTMDFALAWTQATLSSLQEGDMMQIQTCRTIFFSLLLLVSGPVLAANTAGTVTAMEGSVWAQSGDFPERNLHRGDRIYAGERIRTGSGSSVSLLFEDKSRFDLGPSADMVVGKYVFNPGKGESSFTSRIVKGAFRFLSGLIAKKSPRAMTVQLSVATIGIRGTHVAGEVEPTSARVILMQPEEEHPTAIEVFNDYGSVVVDKPGYGTEIPDTHSPPSPVRRMKLRTIDNVMRSLQSVQRIRPSVPRMPMH